MAQAEILSRVTNNEYAFMGLRLFAACLMSAARSKVLA